MALEGVWVFTLEADVVTGTRSFSTTLHVPPTNVVAIAALHKFFTNSSGGTGLAQIASYQTRDIQTGVDSAPIPLNGPLLFENHVVSITFQTSASAPPTSAPFHSGAGASAGFLVLQQ